MPSLRNPINIVFLLQDLEFGGTQRYTIHVLKHLNRQLFAPQLWALCSRTDMEPSVKELGVDPVWLSGTRWVGPHSVARLAARLLKHPPQILYTLTPVPNIWGRLFGIMARVPTMVSSWRGLYPQQYESWMWRLSARIICNANILKEIIMQRHRVPADRISVIRNGVNHAWYTPDHRQKSVTPLVVYVGRLVPDKDPITLVEGFRITAKRVPHARFELIGNGQLKGKIERYVRLHGLQSRVRLIPGQSDTRPYLRRAWVFAMSSVREASPNVILEAMASELPIVAPRVGGIPELIEHGQTGFIFEPQDPQGLADGLTAVLTRESDRTHMGVLARTKVQERHSIDRMVRETERVLLDAAGLPFV